MSFGTYGNEQLSVSCTLTDTWQCDALIATLLHFRHTLTSHREAVADDIDPRMPDPPKPSLADEFAAMFGAASAIEARSDETRSGSARQGESAAGEARDAQG